MIFPNESTGDPEPAKVSAIVTPAAALPLADNELLLSVKATEPPVLKEMVDAPVVRLAEPEPVELKVNVPVCTEVPVA